MHPADHEMATSAAIKLAVAADPTGERTLGIVTKLDLMDQGANAIDVLNGNVSYLRNGFIGVVNRDQIDMTSKESFPEDDEDFFEQRSVLYGPVRHRCGRQQLIDHCNQILMGHMKQAHPSLMKDECGDDANEEELHGAARVRFSFKAAFDMLMGQIEKLKQAPLQVEEMVRDEIMRVHGRASDLLRDRQVDEVLERAMTAKQSLEHKAAAKLFLEAANVSPTSDPDFVKDLISASLEESVYGGDFQQAYELLQSTPLLQETSDAHFAREDRLAYFCINMEDPKALEHCSHAEQLAASCKSPKVQLALAHSKFLLLNKRQILTHVIRKKRGVLCSHASALGSRNVLPSSYQITQTVEC